MNECSAGQVINIQSAVLGYSVLYNLNTHPPRCPWLNCTSPTDEPAKLCNGRRSCSISQMILICDDCCVVDVEALLTFHRCRAARPTGHYFTMNECSAGQVINIQSAVLGYSVLYNPDTRPPTCPWLNCTVSTDVPARLCNGRRSCNISQQILIYPTGSALCYLQKDGNFIIINFICTTGKLSPSIPYFIALYIHLIFT